MFISSSVVTTDKFNVFNHIEMFIEQKHQYSKSNDTKINYENDIKSFYNWKVKSINKYEELIKLTIYDIKLSKTDIMKYKTYLITEIKNAPNTVNRKIGTIKGLYEHFKNVELIDCMDAFLNIKKTKGIDNSYGAFQPHEVFEIAEYLKNKPHTKGKKLNLTKSNLVLFATQTGLRLESILKLKLDDFVKDSHDVKVYAIDKGNELAIMPIDFKLYDDLLEMYEKEGDNNGYMFNISKSGVSRMMKDIHEHFQFPKHRNLVFHSFRKTGVTHVHVMNGRDLIKTQKFSRHKDLNLLQRYVKYDGEMPDYGFVTTSRGINNNLYKEVPHEELLKAIDQLDDSQKLMLNILIRKQIDI